MVQLSKKGKVAVCVFILLCILCLGLNNLAGLKITNVVIYKPVIQHQSAVFFTDGPSRRDRQLAECSHLFQNISFTGNGDHMKLFNINGCELKSYPNRETFQTCFNPGDRIAFIGDSRVRQFYCYLKASWTNTEVNGLAFQNDIVEPLDHLTMEFRWRPFVDDTMIKLFKDWLNGTIPRPTHIYVGAGVWRIRENNASEKEEVNYEKVLNKTLKYLLDLKRKSYVTWLLQDPVDERIKDKMRNMIVNPVINKYNAIAKRVLEYGGIPIFWSAFSAAQHLPNYYRNRVHLYYIVDKYKTRIFLNWQCSMREQLDMCKTTCK